MKRITLHDIGELKYNGSHDAKSYFHIWLHIVDALNRTTWFCSGHERSLVISNHVKLVFVQYFDDVYVVLPLVVLCERRRHETSPCLGLGEGIGSNK